MVKKQWLQSQFKDYDERLLESMAWGTFVQQPFQFLQPQGAQGMEPLKDKLRHVRLGSPALSWSTYTVRSPWQGYWVNPSGQMKLKESCKTSRQKAWG
ncbi:MAG TPA: hypothetical protein DCY88_07015 [Cyanobacteria bacterium UBA11372]|nr:hypothetical protein [Cyanobacteria bacterium UBA11372]